MKSTRSATSLEGANEICRYNIEPHEVVPEVSKGKVHITQNKHVPIEWFVTTASQSRIWLKLLSDGSNKVGICLLCRSTQLHATTSCRSQFATKCDSSYILQSSTPYWKSTTLYYSILQSTNPVLLCTTKYYSSTTLYYKVLLQYYSVLHSTTPVLLCTTQCYSSTTLYYKVLLQYYSVLQSTTPVLLCTTKYYSSTNLYYKVYTVLLQHYSVLQSTTPVLLCTTKYYSSTTLYYKVLIQYTKYYSSTTLYYKVLLQYYSVLQSTTPVLLRTTQYYSSTTQCYSSTTLYYKVLLQYYSLLQSTTKYYSSTTLYYKVLIQYYSVLQSTTPVLLCTTKYYSGSTKYYSSTTPVLQSTTPVLLCTTKYYSSTSLYYKVPSHMKRCLQCAEQQEAASNFSKYCACHEKWLSWSILFTHETLFTMRGATRVSLQLQQVLRLPRKMTLMINPLHTWNAVYNARSNKCHCPNSPNTAPATKNESHDWSLSHMRRYLQCAEQQVSLSKLTKYCACHEKWISWLILVTHDSLSQWLNFKLFGITYLVGKIKFKLFFQGPLAEWDVTLFTMRGATSVIVETHQTLRLPRKMTLQNFGQSSRKQLKRHFQCGTDPNWIREWNRQSATRLATEVTSHAHHEHFLLKNTTFRAPAIIPNFTEYCACHEKWHLNFTKYRACHAKWLSWLILVTYETLFTMRRTTVTGVILQHHRILRLPRKMNLMIDPDHWWNVIYNARSNRCHCPNSPNTAPATQNDSHDWSTSHMERYLQCAEHHVSSSNITEYCACHAKWLSKISDKFLENSWNVISNAGPIRTGSENETVSPQPASQPRLLFTLTTSIFYWKIQHFALRLSFQISPNTAPATKSDTSTSPNTAPATQNDSHDQSSSHMKRYLQCAE